MPQTYCTQGRTESQSLGQGAFTLLELLMVCALISIMLVVSVPGFRNTLFTDPLRQSARQIVGMIREARQRAAGSEKGCFVEIGLDAGTFTLSCPKPPESGDEAEPEEGSEPARILTLPEGVKISSVWDGADEQFSTGEVSLWVNPRGLMETAIINLTDGDDQIGLSNTPFLTDIRIAEQPLGPEGKGG